MEKNNYNNWFENIYPELTNYGMWLRGNEINTLPKEEYLKRQFRMLFVRLSTYNDVSSSFTHGLLYQIASKIPDVFPDIAYLPSENDAKIFKKDNVPWLLGTQTKLSAKAFSLIGFSNSIVQEILNIQSFLKTSNIPIKKSDRINCEDIPILILGGSNALYTSALWDKESLIDGIYIGENILQIEQIIKICADGKKGKKSKIEILQELETVSGFINPDNPKTIISTSNKIETIEQGIMPYNQEDIGTGYLQISRGCRAWCSFCAENWNKKPYKELPEKTLLENALVLKKKSGLESIDIASFNFNMYSDIYKLLWDLLAVFKNVGLKSQRFDMFSKDKSMIEYQHIIGKTSFSCGLEGISPKIRKYLNKNLDGNILYESFQKIFKIKARELKIFILSTGKEDDEDFIEFDKLLFEISKIKQQCDAKTRVIISITPLVKFPFTPLEFDNAYTISIHEKIISKIKYCVIKYKFEVREAMSTVEYIISQILVRASNIRIKNALIKTIEETEFVYYRAIDKIFFYAFIKNLKEEGIDYEDLLKGFDFDESNTKIWAKINMGISRKFLFETCKKNINGQEIKLQLNNIIKTPAHLQQEYKNRIQNIKNNEIQKSFNVFINDSSRGLYRKYIGIALAKALMCADESLTPYFRTYESSYWENDSTKSVWITGDDILILSWDKPAIPILNNKLADQNFINQTNENFKQFGELKIIKSEEKKVKIKIESHFDFEGINYFKKRGLKYTLLKKQNNSYELQFTKDSLKKSIILECSYIRGISMEIVPGKSFNIEEFIKESFLCPNKNDWVKIKTEAKFL